MTGSRKFTWGAIINIVGVLNLVGGVVTTATHVGPWVGIPILALGFPLFVWGGVWLYEGRTEDEQPVIAGRVRRPARS